jgi:hypothetical protein
MKKLIMVGYILPSFLDEEDEDRCEQLKRLFNINDHSDKYALRYEGADHTLCYYSVRSGQPAATQEVIEHMKKGLSADEVLILLHAGNNPNFSRYLTLQEFTGSHIRVRPFSGGSGLLYSNLVSASATIFPTMGEGHQLTAGTISGVLSEVWREYYGSTAFRDKFVKAL